eukprot:m.152801 g.152801  ORF g.152801 m.152801 type:complete len:265 (+) comp38607_c0_seq7:2114-2908(+)
MDSVIPNITFEDSSLILANGTTLLHLNRPLAAIGGSIGLAACLVGQRYPLFTNFLSTSSVMTLVTYIFTPRLFVSTRLCCGPRGLVWLHIAISCFIGLLFGIPSLLRRRLGDFFSNSLMGATVALIILTTPASKILSGSSSVFILITLLATTSGVLTQFISQDLRLIPCTAVSGAYAVVITACAFFNLSVCWALEDIQARVISFMNKQPFVASANLHNRFGTIDYIVLVIWLVCAVLSASFQLLVGSRSFLREILRRRRQLPPL